jgi:C-terminal processing protease CtpA/Prc
VTLTRAEIKIDSVEKNMLEDGIGYIKVNSFTGRTSEEFRNALFSLLHNENSELKSLILDLRDNSGGLLSAAKDVADAFIAEGIIVSTKGRISKFNREYPATPSALCPQEVNLVVLVNGFSASGSEIVAGAIKDSKRGVLLGTKTFGKGVVQQRFSLKNGSGAVSLTISTYYTPSGVSINEKGVMPHKVVEPSELIDPTKLDIVDAVMRQKAGKHVNDFVEGWIETEEKRTGETPKDFSQLEARLAELMSTLAENEITLKSELARIRVRRIFDRNVGINQIPADREDDNQLQEAIQLIRTGGIEQALASTTTTEL